MDVVEYDEIVAKCCTAAELMLKFSGVHGFKFEQEVMKEFIAKIEHKSKEK